MQRSIVILDFGGQYSHLIARRVRQCGVYSEILPPETPVERLKEAAGIILSGGPQSVYDEGSPQAHPALFELGIPVLGICYGMQWMVQELGGNVSRGVVKEYGHTEVRQVGNDVILSPPAGRAGSTKDDVMVRRAHHDDSIFSQCPERFTVWMSHGDEVSDLPEGFEVVLTSDACKNAAFAHPLKQLFAVQFHPEVVHSEYGQEILGQFVHLCNADPWSMENYVENVSRQIIEEVGDRNVFMLVSGGVDSTVAFTLLNTVLGPDRVQGLLVDTGLMRLGEVDMIREAFDNLQIKNLHIIDASDEFFTNLEDVYDPEEKRKIIGQTFLDVQRRVSEDMGLLTDPSPFDGAQGDRLGATAKKIWMLGQGTIYPDTIETGGTAHADTIKTHHNRVEPIERMIEQGLVIEPLKELYKDEVRALGEQLGLPHNLVWRHPFPGPGLGVRILCSKAAFPPPLTPPPVEERNSPSPLERGPAGEEMQALPIRSVGVQGDGRSYRYALALFDRSRYPQKQHWVLSTIIPNSHEHFNRVVFCSSHSAPVDIVFSPGFVTKDRADLSRRADAVVDTAMREADLYEKIWQFPVVLLPFGTSNNGQSIVLRPVESQEAMTANAAELPQEVLRSITEELLKIDGIDMVFYDLTHKPPGTIEWE